ncbi:hypothetical protein D4764_05G0011700 [Takifugu flavidus]|uniref:Uncharacterized protein n=1 Tax=Takifugu flavidus TaxID=433684 RepID=A0A5C6N5N6_9TELE|nr:hypothetical protein D4764_05G0011700 [Takifugu flavidus]
MIDFVVVSSDLRPHVLDTRVKRGAELSTDHHLVVSWLRLWGRMLDRPGRPKPVGRVCWERLAESPVRRSFNSHLRERDIESEWTMFRASFDETADRCCGRKVEPVGQGVLNTHYKTGHQGGIDELICMKNGNFDLATWEDNGEEVLYQHQMGLEEEDEVIQAEELDWTSNLGFRRSNVVFVLVFREYGVSGPLILAVRSLYDRCQSLVHIAGTPPNPVLNWKKVECLLRVKEEILPQVEEFKYLGVLFRSEGRMEQEIDRRRGRRSVRHPQ